MLFPRTMKNTPLSAQVLSAGLILALVFPAPLFGEPHSNPSPALSPEQTWVVPRGERPEQVADALQRMLEDLKRTTGEDFAIVYHQLASSSEHPGLLEAAQALQTRGITVTGSIVTHDEMRRQILESLTGKDGLAKALNIKLDPQTISDSLSRFLSKIGNITLWNHVKKWKAQDWDRTTGREKMVNFGYSFFAGSIAAAWFLFSATATGNESAFATEITRAAGEFMQFDGLGQTLSALVDMGKSFGNLTPTSMAAAGLLTVWVVGYQTFFTAINSFRRQWLSPRFDPTKPKGQQLILGEEKAYNRLFFFLASFGLEMLICTGMLSIFNGGDINGTLLWISAYTSVYSAMGYMPAETLAGNFNQRAGAASRLYHEHLTANGNVVDDLAVVLGQAANTNKTLELTTRYLWWDTIYPAMRNATMLGASGALGTILQYGLMGFFAGGTLIDVNSTRGSLIRRVGNFIRRVMGRDTSGSAPCSTWIEFKSLTATTTPPKTKQ